MSSESLSEPITDEMRSLLVRHLTVSQEQLDMKSISQVLFVLLKRIYMEGCGGYVDSVLWQGTYMLCFKCCTFEQEATLYSILIIVMNQIVLGFDKPDAVPGKQRGLDAVFGACSYLNRYWIPREGGLAFGNDLVRDIAKSRNISLDSGVNYNYAISQVTPEDEPEHVMFQCGTTRVQIPYIAGASPLIDMHGTHCGFTNPIILPDSVELVNKIRDVFVYGKQSGTYVQLMGNYEDVLADLFIDRGLNVNREELFSLISLFNYLDYELLLRLASKKVANVIRGKSAAEIKATFSPEPTEALNML